MDKTMDDSTQANSSTGQLAKVLNSTLEATKRTTANLNAAWAESLLRDTSTHVQPQTEFPHSSSKQRS
jgi:hypothetical protein